MKLKGNMASTSLCITLLTTKCKCAFQAHFNQPNWCLH